MRHCHASLPRVTAMHHCHASLHTLAHSRTPSHIRSPFFFLLLFIIIICYYYHLMVGGALHSSSSYYLLLLFVIIIILWCVVYVCGVCDDECVMSGDGGGGGGGVPCHAPWLTSYVKHTRHARLSARLPWLDCAAAMVTLRACPCSSQPSPAMTRTEWWGGLISPKAHGWAAGTSMGCRRRNTGASPCMRDRIWGIAGRHSRGAIKI